MNTLPTTSRLGRSARLAGLVWITVVAAAVGSDWPRFRGLDGSGVSPVTGVPTTWSDRENLLWAADLPGAGSSSPILVGDRVYVTCYSGYGPNGGKMEDLTRHLVCLDQATGKILWDAKVPAVQPEDRYEGYLREHGYASSTPVAEGDSIYVFFGKSGVLAFDLDGKQRWQVSVGTESSNRRWGSGSSLILHKNLVIVNASEESQSIRALDKATGNEVWRSQAAMIELAYNTPTLIKRPDGDSDLVFPVPNEVWGLNPDTGKLRWYCNSGLGGNISPTTVGSDDGIAYIFGGFPQRGSLAVRVGGTGDVTRGNVVWTSRDSSYVATPVLYQNHLYWVDDRGTAQAMRTQDGASVYKERLAVSGGGRPVYASPVIAEGKIYVVSRRSGTFVLAASPNFQQLAVNKFDDDSDFNATPAIAPSRLYLRSDRRLYCVGK